MKSAFVYTLAALVCGMVFLLSQESAFGQSPQPTPQEKTSEQVQANDLPASPFDSLNRRLPTWVRFSGELRARLEGYAGGFNPNNEDTYLLTRVRLNMKIQPTPWMRFFFQGQDAHAPWKNTNPKGAPFRDTMDLRQAYVEFGNVEIKTVGLRMGRQELDFGEGRMIGALPWTNTARSFDGIRGSFRSDKFRVDAFAASVVKINQGQFDENIPGNNIYGLYSSFSKLIPKATVEPYFFWRRQSGLRTEIGIPGTMNFGTVGFRWVGKLPAGFDYGTDVAKQAGSLGSESIGAWAGHWLLGYTISSRRFTPRIFAEYNHATGDHSPTDNHLGTFDQLYPTGHDKYGLTDQVGWKNIHHVRGAVEFKFTKKWSVAGKHNAYWLADSHDALYNGLGNSIAREVSGASGRYVGQELDFVTFYNFNKRTVFSGGFGHLFPGTFLSRVTPGAAYNYSYAMATYAF